MQSHTTRHTHTQDIKIEKKERAYLAGITLSHVRIWLALEISLRLEFAVMELGEQGAAEFGLGTEGYVFS